MQLTDVQNHAIQARIALIVGATVFDRIFAVVRFAEAEGPLLYVHHAKDEATAMEIEGTYSLHIAMVATGILNRDIELIFVVPKVFN